MRLAVVLLAALFVAGVPAASHSASDRCFSIPDSGDQDCDGARTDGANGGETDNCPTIKNADQLNTDRSYTPTEPAAADGSSKAMGSGDGAGDACDDDDDADGVPDASDVCRIVRNPDQNPDDRETRCPPVDSDGDGARDDEDNCPTIANADQADLDQDRRGDVCEYDDDGDSVPDGRDNCPTAANSEQGDNDGDGVGTACDTSDIPPVEEASFTPDRQPPSVRLTSAFRRSAADARGGLPTVVRCSERCALTATLTFRGARRANADAALGAEGRTWLFFRFRRGALSRIPRRGVRATLRVTATDAAGNRASVTRRLLLRRR